MRTFAGLLVVGLFLFESFVSAPCFGNQPFQYPRVYGPTGRLYGPTQAHYQYQRQYGRAWHGYRGLTASNGPRQHHITIDTGNYYPWAGLANPYAWSPGVTFGGYPGFYGGPVTYGWVPKQSPFPGGVDYQLQPFPAYVPPPTGYYGLGYQSPQPNYQQPSTVWTDPVLRSAWEENLERWKEPITTKPIAPRAQANLKPATPDEQLEAAQKKARGDTHLQEQNYFQALRRYREAIRENPHDADLHFREGFAFVALGQFEEAVDSFKQGLRIDPDYPSSGVTLNEVYGAEREIAQTSFQHRVAEWVREDIRDPDRLFLMGALLHFDQDQTRSQPFFEAAYRLAGRGAHIMAFLRPSVEQVSRRPVNVGSSREAMRGTGSSDSDAENAAPSGFVEPSDTTQPSPAPMEPPASIEQGGAGDPGPAFPEPI